MGGAAAIVSGSILVSRLLGLLRETLLAALLGVSSAGDVYRDAFFVPDLLNYLMAGGFLTITLVPILAKRLEAGEVEGSHRDFTAVFWTMAGAIAALTLVLWAAAPPLVEALFRTLPASDQAEIAQLTRIALPAQIFFVLGSLFMAYSYAKRRFLYPALAPVIYNLGIIFGGLLGAADGDPSPAGFVWGAVIGAAVGNFGVQWLGARTAGLRLRRPGAATRPALAQYFALAIPLMIGQSVAVLDEQFVRVFGQLGGAGGTAALSFARMLNMVPIGIIAQAAGVAAFPFLAGLAAKSDWSGLAGTTQRAIRATLVISAGATAVVYAVARPAIRIVYQWGRFSVEDTALVASLLAVYCLSIPAWGAQQVAARSFYARRRMWLPVGWGTLVTVLAIPLHLWLFRAFDLPGLAWASVISISMYATILYVRWRQTDGELAPATSSLWRLVPGALLAAVAGRLVASALSGELALGPSLLGLVGAALITASVYLLICLALRVPEVRAIMGRLPGARPQSSGRDRSG
jgi:putative peptidoglycan lipid II flippase